jgi:hypothetical protein
MIQLEYVAISLLEGAALDTSTSLSRGNDDSPSTGQTSIVCKEFAIATETRVTAVKDW